MEIRTVVTQILLQFDVSFAPGEDGTSLLEKTKDYFTLGLGDLNLVFEKRKSWWEVGSVVGAGMMIHVMVGIVTYHDDIDMASTW
jgi:hypothetical protein